MRAVVLALLVLLVRTAHADIGVVVTGDPSMQAPLIAHAQHWIQKKNRDLVAAPLGSAAASMIDCFVIDDMACARKVYAEHAKAKVVVFVRIDMQSGDRNYLLQAYWFEGKREPAHAKKSCAPCDDVALGVSVDTAMSELLEASGATRGKLKIDATSPGMVIKVDGTEVGTAPLEHEISAGSHELVFIHDGMPVEVRRIEVEPGGVVQLQAPRLADNSESGPEHGRSRTASTLMLVGGLAASAVGGVLLYYGSLRGPDEPYVYTNATEIGLPLALAGAFAVGFGISGTF